MSSDTIQLETEQRPPVQPQNKVRAAMVKAWGKFPAVIKDRDNSITRSRYATLDSVIETIKPVLAECELMPRQDLTTTERSVTVYTQLIHSSGEAIEFSPLTLPVVGKRISGGGGSYSTDNGPQEFGSAITYARRYALLAGLGISTGDDDDGNQGQPHRSAHTNTAPPKKGSALKKKVVENKDEPLGKDAAKKLITYAAERGVDIEQIREHLSTQGSNHAKACEQPPEKWPAAWRGTISTFLSSQPAPKKEKEAAK